MINKNMSLYALVVVIVFSMTGCGDDTYIEQTYYGSKLVIANEQVWLRNNSANRLSQAYEKLNGDSYGITVFSEYNEEMDETIDYEIGLGSINGGKLSFTVEVPDNDNLLKWDDLKKFFNIVVEGEGWDVEIDEEATKGTFILLMTDVDEYALIREGVSGTSSSLSDESVLFIYVDQDCIITGEAKEDERVLYTFNPFTLSLKAGWNTIWYKQTYTTSGRSSFDMDIKNPDLKWVLIPTVPTK
jgi:hypothetical protein